MPLESKGDRNLDPHAAGRATPTFDHGRRPIASAFLWIIMLGGCESCDCGGAAPDVLATLTEKQGSVQRDYAAEVGTWRTAIAGGEFRLGDGIRARADGRAVLDLADGSVAELQPGAMVRFLLEAPEGGGLGLDIQMGEATLIIGDQPLILTTHLGLATLLPGSRVSLARTGSGNLVFRVEIGGAVIQSADGKRTILKAGETLEVSIGMAIVGDLPPEAEDPEEPDHGMPPDGGIPVGTDLSRLPKHARSLARASVVARAGETFTVHSPTRKATIGIPVPEACPQSAVLTLTSWRSRGRRIFGKGQINVEIAGRYAYRLNCVTDGKPQGKPVARGTMTVRRDSGLGRLPRRAPTSEVRADGRTYKVQYPNQLPRIDFSWRSAPKSSEYILRTSGPGNDRTVSVKKPRHVFKSGQLREGTHTLYFEAASGKRSRKTTLVIGFDNSAPRASISSPKERGFSAGDTVSLVGVAARGSTVSTAAGPVKLDGQHRFSVELTTSAARPDVAVRVKHPRHGTHYYLRRARGSGR